MIVLPDAHAQEIDKSDTVDLYLFWGDGCPHCEKERIFLEQLKQKYPELSVHEYEVWGNSKNRDLMIEFAEKLNATVNGVPFTIIGENYTVGWLNEESTGAQIENSIKCVLNNSCSDIVIEIDGKEKDSRIPEIITLPILGEIQTKNISLPALTIIIGLLDGFNPCAMWTLIFLISLLLGMQNRTRMWILGSTFIVTSATVYFLFLSAWLNLLLFIGFILWVRLGIALVALGGGGYYLKEYFFNPHSTCVVTKSEKRKKIFEKLKVLAREKHILIAFIGIILLAVAVNLVELICSAGLPAIYTQILILSDLPVWQYYGYLLLYIFFFMLDDLLVFSIAMITLRITGFSSKYSRVSHLVGGIAMVVIGILLIFKPEWLMFG